jgi:two-component system, NarL family, sensor histidine kinase DesK
MADARRRRLPIFEQGVMPFIWLVYAAGVPMWLFLSHSPPRLVAFQLAVLAVFLVCYFLGYGRGGRTGLAYAAVIAVLGAIAAPTVGYATTYFIYTVSFVAYAVPAREAYRILAIYIPLVALVMWLTHVDTAAAISGLIFGVIVGVACINTAQQKNDHARLKQAYDQIEGLAKIAERERIARDLHDVLGHTLSLIALKSQLASKLADRDPRRAITEIREVEQIARTSLDELREAVAGYRGTGIPDELAHARDVLTSAGLHVDCEAEDVRLPAPQESVLALAIREAVTNIVRHARASVVRLRVGTAGEACRFEIQDDGVGGSAKEGLGLTGMRERVESYGGSLERTIDHGTRLVVTLPLASGAAR